MKQTQMVKISILLCFFFAVVLLSCEKSSHEQTQPRTLTAPLRASFKSTNDFISAANQISGMSDDEVIAWELRNNKSSLRNSLFSKPSDYEYSDAENELLNFPKSHLSLLNKDSEVQIGDSVIWYNKGNKYYVHQDQISLLPRIKQDEQFASKFKGNNYSIRLQHHKDPEISTNSITVGINHLDARYQREFTQNAPVSGCRKYVNEIRTFADYFSANDPFCGSIFTIYTTATLSIKLEWRNCSRSRYRPAGESRQISYNLTNDVKLLGMVLPCSTTPFMPSTFTNISDSQVRTSQLDVLLFSWSGNSRYLPTYQIQLSGTISQNVVGDTPGNAWHLTGNPLW